MNFQDHPLTGGNLITDNLCASINRPRPRFQNSGFGQLCIVSRNTSFRKVQVKEICHQHGGNIWLYGGASLITTFINLDLIDVYRLAIYPVILGEGKPVFDSLKRRINLKLQQVKGSESGIAFLEFNREGKPGSGNKQS